ncbi:MAG: hypothetical protein IPL50_19115 [Chitinophagaceae bacterium]|nr:hypothetical protein [Chitinophagaceae bacterium]
MKKNLLNQFREVKIHATILLLIVSQNCFSQISLIDSVIQKNSYVINVENEKLTGPAAEFLAKTAKDCQFMALGEEHNVYDIPIFTTALFALLQQSNGFQYLATEQDPVRSQILSRPEYRGNRDTAFHY